MIYAGPYNTETSQERNTDVYRITQELGTNFAVSNKTTSGCGKDLFHRGQSSCMFMI